MLSKCTLLCLLIGSPSIGADGFTQHRDDATRLLIRYPTNWFVEGGDDSFTITSFNPHLRPAQVLVPINEAQIVVAAPPSGVTSVAEWLYSDRVEALGLQVSTTRVFNKRLGELPATLVKGDLMAITQGRLTMYIFELNSHLVKVSLLYRGTTRAKEFQDIFETLIEALEPIAPTVPR